MNWLNRFQTNVVYLIKQIGSNQKLPPDGSLVEEMFDSDRRASQLHRVVGRISGRVTCTICYYLYLYLYYLYYLHNALLTFARLAHSMHYLSLHSLYYLQQYLPTFTICTTCEPCIASAPSCCQNKWLAPCWASSARKEEVSTHQPEENEIRTFLMIYHSVQIR